MPAKQEAISELYHGYDSGESGWGDQISANFLKIGALMQIRVLDRDLSAPPGSPVEGGCYIVASGASGSWAGKENHLAVYRSDIPGWEFYEPRVGWVASIIDEEKLSMYKIGGWSAGISI